VTPGEEFWRFVREMQGGYGLVVKLFVAGCEKSGLRLCQRVGNLCGHARVVFEQSDVGF